jgi:phosphoglycerate dehydrogenase-like enzyme
MMRTTSTHKIAVLDDYQGVALAMADWSGVQQRASIQVFADTIEDPDALVGRLLPFDALCLMRERTPLPRRVIERLPRLALIVSTGPKNSSIDRDAASEHGILVKDTRGSLTAPIELTWALIQASARNIASEAAHLRAGGWQRTVGDELKGQTLGILGLGRIGGKIAEIARVFEMNVITWSDRTTQEEAEKAGARLVTKHQLFGESDILTIHLVLVEATRGLVGAKELARMKSTARLVNTSRAAIVDEAALIKALADNNLAGAALDVFDKEPLPADHAFRTLGNVVATPHLGYVSRQQYKVWYEDTVQHLTAWLDTRSAEADRAPVAVNSR